MPMHTQPDLHTKTKKDSQIDNIQEGGSDTINDEKIEDSKDINHLLKESKPLINEDNPVEFNDRKRKLLGDDIHNSFLHPNFVKTSKISFPTPKSSKKTSNNSVKNVPTAPKTKEIKHKFQFA